MTAVGHLAPAQSAHPVQLPRGTVTIRVHTDLAQTRTGSIFYPLEVRSGGKPLVFYNHEEFKKHVDSIIEQVAAKYGQDPRTLRAILAHESDYNPAAESKKGARGLMQLRPIAFEDLKAAGIIDVQNPFDVKDNIEAGAAYLHRLQTYYLPRVLDRRSAQNADFLRRVTIGSYNAGVPRNTAEAASIAKSRYTHSMLKRIAALAKTKK